MGTDRSEYDLAYAEECAREYEAPPASSSERRCDAVDAETQYQIDSIRARRFSNFHGTAEEWVEFEYGLVGKCVLPATRAGEATTTPTEAAEIARLTSELKAVQERAASEISELAVAVTDLKFELHNAGFEIEQLKGEVERFSTLADERHDLLCAERRTGDNLRAEVISLNSDWKVMRGKWRTARADAINEALMAVEDLRKAYPESVFTRHLLNVVVAALETLKQKESSFQK